MSLIINVVAFKAGWLLSVIGGAQQLPWLGPLAVFCAVVMHLLRARKPSAELRLIIACGVVGGCFDSLLVTAGWVQYPAGMFHAMLAPYWIVTMWMLFATTLNVALRWLRGRQLIAAMFGFVGGPLAYLAGHKLGAIVFVEQFAALATLALGWAVLMPSLMRLSALLDGIAEPQRQAKDGVA